MGPINTDEGPEAGMVSFACRQASIDVVQSIPEYHLQAGIKLQNQPEIAVQSKQGIKAPNMVAIAYPIIEPPEGTGIMKNHTTTSTELCHEASVIENGQEEAER